MKVPTYSGPDAQVRFIKWLQRQFPLEPEEVGIRPYFRSAGLFAVPFVEASCLSYTTTRAGSYVLIGQFETAGGAAGWGGVRARFRADGVFTAPTGIWYEVNGGPAQVTWATFCAIDAGKVIEIMAKKNVNAGGVQITPMMIFIGPFGPPDT